jgi:hypothetical protein
MLAQPSPAQPIFSPHSSSSVTIPHPQLQQAAIAKKKKKKKKEAEGSSRGGGGPGVLGGGEPFELFPPRKTKDERERESWQKHKSSAQRTLHGGAQQHTAKQSKTEQSKAKHSTTQQHGGRASGRVKVTCQFSQEKRRKGRENDGARREEGEVKLV